ncbi:MAG: cytochrome P450 [Anaerolineae bacterium]
MERVVADTWQDGITGAPQPPKAAGLPLLGSVIPMAKDPIHFLVDQYRELGPIFKVQALHRNFTILAGPQANLFMTKHGDKYLSGRDSWTTFADEVDSQYFMAAIDGKVHKQMRSIIKKPYSRQNLLSKIPDVVQTVDTFTQGWGAGDSFSTFSKMQVLIADQIGTLLLGHGPGEYFSDFAYFMRTILNAVLGQRPKLSLKMPGYLHAKARVMELANNMIEAHRANPNPPEDHDIIDFLLKAQVTDPELMTEPEIVLATLGPYLAGIDTAAGTLAFVLYALFKNPEVIERLVPEIDAAFAEGPPDSKALRGMHILHGVILESMRLYPVAPMLPRHVVEPFEFAGHQLNVGDPVMLANGVAHFDGAIYKDPDRFDIDRILDPRKEHRQPGAFAPYGLGAHTCAGAGFAEVEIMVTIATLFHRFELSMAPADYELKRVFNPSPAPTKEFQFNIVKRRHDAS